MTERAFHISLVCAVLVFTCSLSVITSPTWAEVRIRNDRGGQIGPYMEALSKIRQSGQRVVIDGDCFSACTLITAMIPAQRVCVTPRARLGFHAAKADRAATAVTKALWEMYPAHIRDWLARNGGLGGRILILRGPELRTFYQSCE